MSSSLANEIIARTDSDENCIHLEDLVRPPYNSVTAANQAALWWSSGALTYQPVGPDEDRQRLLDDKAEFLQVQRRFNSLRGMGVTDFCMVAKLGPITFTFSAGEAFKNSYRNGSGPGSWSR
jgi:hypothetical protein